MWLCHITTGDGNDGGAEHLHLLHIDALALYVGPVSYTHLDVYKRQVNSKSSNRTSLEFFQEV